MGNLFTSVLNAANAISVFDRQLATIQNNVANANTPGYVRQIQPLEAMRFDVAAGLPGGVSAGPVVSARYEYAEQNVRGQFTRQGYAEQKAGDLARVEPLFDPTASFGVAGSITSFFRSFSQLSVNPNDRVARESVIDSARTLADTFNQTATGLANAGQEADKQIRDTVAAINRLGAQIRDINTVYRQNSESGADAGLDARLHSTLEELSELVDFSMIQSSDGTMAVYLGSQTPLVVGDHQFSISTDLSTPQTAILDSSGGDMTGQLHFGRLKALIDEKNVQIPSYLGDLDTLAQTLADQVNAQLASGVDASGAAPTLDLFRYTAAQGVARSFSVTEIIPGQLAAAAPDSPGGNANALALARMLDAKAVDGFTFAEYFGAIGGRVGRDLASAREEATTRSALTNQARTFREQISGVSLDVEAAHLLQVQRAYQASAKLMTVLNEITDTLIQALR